MNLHQTLQQGITLGCIATVVFDTWLMCQKLLGYKILNFAYLGRWIGHFKTIKFVHEDISKAERIDKEIWIGLAAHYAIGILIAEILLLVVRAEWLESPELGSALGVGMATVIFPLAIMQPAMGGGIAFSKTQHPFKNSIKSCFNHGVFGLCLYAAGWIKLYFQ